MCGPILAPAAVRDRLAARSITVSVPMTAMIICLLNRVLSESRRGDGSLFYGGSNGQAESVYEIYVDYHCRNSDGCFESLNLVKPVLRGSSDSSHIAS